MSASKPLEPPPTPDERLTLLHAKIVRREHEGAYVLAEELLQDTMAAGRLEVGAMAAALASVVGTRTGETETAARYAMQAMRLAELSGRPQTLAHAQVAAARVSWRVGELDEALSALEAALPVAEHSNDTELAFHCFNMLGIVYSELGQPERSIEWHQLARERGAVGNASQSPQVMAALADSNAAARWIEIGDKRQSAGDDDGARQAWRTGVAALQKVIAELAPHSAAGTALVSTSNLALLYVRLNDADNAPRLLDEVDRLARELGDSMVECANGATRAQWLKATGRSREALQTAWGVMEACEKAQAYNSLQELCVTLAGWAEEAGDLPGALRCYKRLVSLKDRLVLERAELRSRVVAVRVEAERAVADAARARSRAQVLEAQAQDLLQEASTDPLTGLGNRRRWRALQDSVKLAGPAMLPMCVAMVDVDHFKRVNDNFGHAVGDAVLQALARLMRDHGRDLDTPLRLGGEEFALVLVGTDLAAAGAACERLRCAVEAHAWAGIEPGLAVTISVGVAEVPSSMDFAVALGLADHRLYQAKQTGRNRVVRA